MKFSFTKNNAKSSSVKSTKSQNEVRDCNTTKVTKFQERLAVESELILTEKLVHKIAELDEICCKDELWTIKRIPEIRSETEKCLDKYFEDSQVEEDENAASNPLMQLLTGGMSGQKSEESVDEATQSKIPSKLLLSKIKLSEDNKVSLKISLELDNNQKESQRTESSASVVEGSLEEICEPPAKRAKTSEIEDKQAQEATDQPQEPTEQAADESTEKTNETPTDPQQLQQDTPADEAQVCAKKEEHPVLKSHPLIVELIQLIKPQIDEIVDWCVTLRVYMLNSMQRNRNLGGADLNAECQAVIIEEIKGIEDEFGAYKEALGAYYLTKATILEKYVKAPEMEDLKNFILDEDEKMFVTCRTIVLALRNQTLSLYDAIQKDADRLFSDQTETTSMNFGMY